MKAVVFLGPSTPCDATCSEGMDVRPPAVAGDIHGAVTEGVDLIGLIDGRFENCRAVLHDEILFALSTGVQVFGAASLGALRAVECEPFGMRGVGDVFELYRSGEIEDEHEVALTHGPPELGSPPTSVPLINFRLNIRDALADEVISRGDANGLMTLAKQFFYKNLTLANYEQSLPEPLRPAWSAVVSRGFEDFKRRDAAHLMRVMRDAMEHPDLNDSACPEFQETWFWRANRMEMERRQRQRSAEDTAVLDELRLSPARYSAYKADAALRCALDGTLAVDPTLATPKDLVDDLRLRLGLTTRTSFVDWLDRNKITRETLERHLERAYKADSAQADFRFVVETEILNELRANGLFLKLKKRWEAKSAYIRNIAEADVHGQNGRHQNFDLITWFSQRSGIKYESYDVEYFTDELGFSEQDDFFCALKNEYLFELHEKSQL